MCNNTVMSALTNYRNDESKSREQLAEMLSVDPVTVWRWETGAIQVPAERALQIESITGIPRAKLRPDLFGDAA